MEHDISISERAPSPRKVGNGCGHNPRQPRLSLQSSDSMGKAKVLPRLLTLAQERLDQLYKDRNCLPFLKTSSRQMRSERAEAIILVLKALLSYMNIVTMKCGWIRDYPEGFENISMAMIVDKTGMTQRRCERAIRVLKESGYITVSQYRETKEDGTIVPFRATRRLMEVLFELLMLDGILRTERKKRTIPLQAFCKRMGVQMTQLVNAAKHKHIPKGPPQVVASNQHRLKLSYDKRCEWMQQYTEYMAKLPPDMDIVEKVKASAIAINEKWGLPNCTSNPGEL